MSTEAVGERGSRNPHPTSGNPLCLCPGRAFPHVPAAVALLLDAHGLVWAARRPQPDRGLPRQGPQRHGRSPN